MMSFKRLGDYIQKVNNRNKDLAVSNLMGVNIYKNFMPSVANQSGLDLSKYKVIKKEQFATNLMHVNRDEVLPVALYTNEEPALVSPAYITFEVIDVEEVLPEFLMMEFQRPEFNRKAWTYCDSSVRGGLEWERLCDLEIPDIDIDEQRKYIALYKGLLANQKVYENSLKDLQLICDTYIEDLITKEPLKRLGEYIQQPYEIFPNTVINLASDYFVTQQLHYIINRNRWGIFHLGSVDLVYHNEFISQLVTGLNAPKNQYTSTYLLAIQTAILQHCPNTTTCQNTCTTPQNRCYKIPCAPS